MKIKPYSRILAGTYVGCGLMLFLLMPYLLSLLSETGGFAPMPNYTRVVFRVGPLGWLLVMSAVGALVILKDFKFRSGLLNAIFTAFFALLVSGIAFAVGTWFASSFDLMSE